MEGQFIWMSFIESVLMGCCSVCYALVILYCLLNLLFPAPNLQDELCLLFKIVIFKCKGYIVPEFSSIQAEGPVVILQDQ